MTENMRFGMEIASKADLAAIGQFLSELARLSQEGVDLVEAMAGITGASDDAEEAMDDVKKAVEYLGDSFGDVVNQADDVVEALEDAAENVEDFGKKTEGTGESGKRGFDVLKAAVVGFLAGGGLQMAQEWLGKVASALKDVVFAGVEWADQVKDLSRMTGMSAEDASRFAAAVQSIGVDTDIAKDSLGYVIEALNEAGQAAGRGEEATGPVAEAFAALGISALTADGQVRPMAELLPEIADKLAALPEGAQRSGTAIQIFGGQAAELLPMLENGSKGMEELMGRADELGLVMSEETAEGAEELKESLARVNQDFDAMRIAAGTALMPALEGLADFLDGTLLRVLRDINQEAARREFVRALEEAYEEVLKAREATEDYAEEQAELNEKYKKAEEAMELLVQKAPEVVEELYAQEQAFKNVKIGGYDMADGLKEAYLSGDLLAELSGGLAITQEELADKTIAAAAAIVEEEQAAEEAARAASGLDTWLQQVAQDSGSAYAEAQKYSDELANVFVQGKDGAWEMDSAIVELSRSVDEQRARAQELQAVYEEMFAPAVFGVEGLAERLEGVTGSMERTGEVSFSTLMGIVEGAAGVSEQIAGMEGMFPEEEAERFLGQVGEIRAMVEQADIGELAKQELLDMLASAGEAVAESKDETVRMSEEAAHELAEMMGETADETSAAMDEFAEESTGALGEVSLEAQAVVGDLEAIEEAAREAAAAMASMSIPGVGGGEFPVYQHGGWVLETGLIKAEKGEYVLTPEEAQAYKAGQSKKEVYAPMYFTIANEMDLERVAYQVAQILSRRA